MTHSKVFVPLLVLMAFGLVAGTLALRTHADNESPNPIHDGTEPDDSKQTSDNEEPGERDTNSDSPFPIAKKDGVEKKTCKNGCSIHHHPIQSLTRGGFEKLMKRYGQSDQKNGSEALDHLLYYGHQTERFLRNQKGEEKLVSSKRRTYLTRELSRETARVSIRVVDEHGKLRLKVNDETVRLGESKHFPVETVSDMHPPHLSGTVYRVGLNHLWARY